MNVLFRRFDNLLWPRMLAVTLLVVATLFLWLATAPARAAFGLQPGGVIGKAHPTVPLLTVTPKPGEQKSAPFTNRIANRAGIEAAPFVSQAGAHPDATGAAILEGVPPDAPKDLIVDTPPGFIGNPNAVPSCSREAFARSAPGEPGENKCQVASQVGVVTVKTQAVALLAAPVYRLTPSPGFPASFGFVYPNPGVGIVINVNLRTDEDYGLAIGSTQISAQSPLRSVTFTLWGVPASPIHDPERYDPLTASWGASSGQPQLPFIQTPTDCGATNLVSTTRLDSWQAPGQFLPGNPFDANYAAPAPRPTGCHSLSFEPTISVLPTTSNSDSPTGLHLQLDIPQNYDPEALSTPQLKKTVLTLPQGMSVNPAAADGIEGCSTQQIGLLTAHGAYPNPIRFAAGAAHCPEAAKIGTGVVETKLLEEPLEGDVYLATPYDNPFHSLLAMYLVFDGPGFTIKLPGKVEADPTTGQLTTTVDYSPQLPFDKLTLDLFAGPRAPLATSPICGEQRTETALTPWSAPDTPVASLISKYIAADGPATGGGCSHTAASRPFHPQLSIGTENPIAGTYSSLRMRLSRADGDQPLAGLTVKAPPGFTAKLAGIPYCPEAHLRAAGRRSGASEAASPSCPEASLVGRVLVGAGAGPSPLYTEGKAYLAGPYRGAPLSLAVITPALAGGTPGNRLFDLGNVVVRVALFVNPETAQVTAVSDPFPQNLLGIPLRIRDIRLALDRREFGLNPTDCAEMAFEARATGQDGAAASLSSRFQALECAGLKFKPRLHLRLKGATKRSGHPALKAVVTYPEKGAYANIARAQVGLPHSEFLDQGNLDKVCRQADLRAGTCPKRSIYGRARAWTPLLDKPLEGPVYLGVGFGYKLPALVADLNGQVRILLKGRVDTTKHDGIRNTFEAVPDAPVSRFVLEMKGGKRYGLLTNSENICKKTQRASALFHAQNGERLHMRPRIANDCKHRKKRRRHKAHARASAQRQAAHNSQRRQ